LRRSAAEGAPSGIGRRAGEGRLAFYGATKHALLVAMEWLRIEQDRGVINSHVLIPGAVYTPLIVKALPENRYQA